MPYPVYFFFLNFYIKEGDIMGIPKFVKQDGDVLTYNGDGEFIFFIPEKWFDTNIAQIHGDLINLIGILDYTIADENGKFGKLKHFYFPSAFVTRPHAMEKRKGIVLTANTPPLDYRLLKYKKGSEIICSTKVPILADNIEEVYRMFLNGNMTITQTFPYDKLQDVFMDSVQLGGSSYENTMQLLGVVIAGIARCPDDKTKPFRCGDISNKFNYKVVPVDKIAKYTSPQTAITSQNWDEACMAMVKLSANDKIDSISPIEKLLMENFDIGSNADK